MFWQGLVLFYEAEDVCVVRGEDVFVGVPAVGAAFDCVEGFGGGAVGDGEVVAAYCFGDDEGGW